MKKIFSISMFFAAAAITFASCSKEETTVNTKPELSGETKTITITSAIAETRTQLSADHKITWADGDTYGIIFADADYNIVGNTTSPEYVSGQSDYKLEGVPAETKYLCCYYPAGLFTNYTLMLLKDLSNVTIDLWRDGEFADANVMLSKGEVTDENTVDISFEQVVTILEVNVYDSNATGNDYYYGVTVSASEAFAGEAKYDFTSDSATLTDFADKDFTIYRSSVIDSNKVSSTKEDGSKFYFAVGKGTYSELEISVTINVNGDYEHNTTSVVKFPNADLSQYAGYTINIDLASAEEPEVEEPLFSAPSADDEGGEYEWNEYHDSFNYGYDDDYDSVQQYGLTMRNTKSVTFATAPEDVTIKAYYFESGFFGDSSETEAVFTLENGKLTISNFDEVGSHAFRLYFYESGDEFAPIAIIALTYYKALPTVENTDTISGASTGTQYTATLSELSSGDGYLSEYDCKQYKLEVESNAETVYFEAIPDVEYVVFEDKTSKETVSGLFEKGIAGAYSIGKPTSGAYWVAFGGTEEPSCILYVVIQ